MKCGGYCLKLFMCVFPYGIYMLSIRVTILRIIGLLIMPIICMVLSDSKKVIAYRSIVHITIPIASLIRIIDTRISAVIIVLFAHGLVSPLIFICIGEKKSLLGSRNMELIKGTRTFKVFIIWFFVVV